MTLLGKLLVVFNLGFALMLAAWSFSLYSNGVDWTDTKTNGVPTGQFAIRAAKLDELWKGVAPVQKDLQEARNKLAREESHLADERVWYDKEIQYVLTGDTAKGGGIKGIMIAPKDDAQNKVQKGMMMLDQQELPQMEPPLDPNGNPLQLKSLREYNDDDDALLKSLKDVMAQNEKEIEDANRLTDLIIGDKAKGDRGFQQRISDEKVKNADVLAELKLVEPQLINTLVEGQLVSQRHAQMKKRVEELKKPKVASK
jgi:hypothetical protein